MKNYQLSSTSSGMFLRRCWGQLVANRPFPAFLPLGCDLRLVSMPANYVVALPSFILIPPFLFFFLLT